MPPEPGDDSGKRRTVTVDPYHGPIPSVGDRWENTLLGGYEDLRFVGVTKFFHAEVRHGDARNIDCVECRCLLERAG
jgi:hypothetical protein